MSSLLFYKIFRTSSSKNFAEERTSSSHYPMVKILSVRFQKKGQLNSGKDMLPTAYCHCQLPLPLPTISFSMLKIY